MIGLFENIGSALSGLFGGLIPPAAAQPQTPSMMPPSVGMADRLGAGFQSLINSGSPVSGLVNGIGALMSGKRTDPAGVQQEAVRGMLNHLVSTRQISPVDAQFLAANPSAWGELSKAMINQPMTVAPSGDILINRPFGRIGVPGAVPISERADTVNPDGSRSPGFAIKPSLVNPRGGLVAPGAQPGGQTMLNPNLPNGGRGIITEQSPQATEEQRGVGGNLAEEYKDISKKAAAATTRLGTLSRLSQLSPQAYEGAGAPALQLVRSFLTTLGIPAGAVPAGEEFTALSNKMVLDANNGSLGTGVSNADVQFIKNMQPEMSQTREGREQLIATATKLAKRDQEVAKEAQKYRQQHGSLEGFQVYIQEWAERNPLFKDVAPPAANFGERFGAAFPGPGSAGIRIIGVR